MNFRAANSFLTAIYDLRVSPASYDFIQFLVSAEIWRQSRGLTHTKLLIVKNVENYGFRSDGYRPAIQNYTFFNNVMLPAIQLFPSVEDVVILSADSKLISEYVHEPVFPLDWTINNPTQGHFCEILVLLHGKNKDNIPYDSGLRVPTYAIEYVRAILEPYVAGRKLVTITSRELSREDTQGRRRLSIPEWNSYINWLNRTNDYAVLCVRDAAYAFSTNPLLNALEIPELSFNLHYRAALYDISYLNFFKPNGPATLSMFNSKSKTIMFNLPDNGPSTSLEFLENYLSLLPGDQFPCTNKSCLLTWDDDTFENIVSAHEVMEQRALSGILDKPNNVPYDWCKRGCYLRYKKRFFI